MSTQPLVTAGLLLGIGMGGFVDGIVFHQILQFHGMLTAVRPKVTLADAEINMFWDGLFHLLTWTVTAVGIAALFRAGGRTDVVWSGRALFGAMLAGWGLFNFVEGIIDHYLLGIHHVVEAAGLSVYDHAFVLSGLVFVVVGWTMTKGADRARSRA